MDSPSESVGFKNGDSIFTEMETPTGPVGDSISSRAGDSNGNAPERRIQQNSKGIAPRFRELPEVWPGKKFA